MRMIIRTCSIGIKRGDHIVEVRGGVLETEVGCQIQLIITEVEGEETKIENHQEQLAQDGMEVIIKIPTMAEEAGMEKEVARMEATIKILLMAEEAGMEK